MEFIPSFQLDSIQSSSIIGVETDYTPLYEMINLDCFSFHFNYHTSNELVKSRVLEFIQTNHHQLNIIMSVDFNNKIYNCQYQADLSMLSFNHDKDYTYIFLYDILSRLYIQMKYNIYNLSIFKIDLDRIYNNLSNQDTVSNIDYIIEHQAVMKELLLNELKETEQSISLKLDEIIKGKKMPIEMDNTIETLNEIKEAVSPDTTEEDEYQRISDYIDERVTTLRLTRKTIKHLPKSKSNKFVLPLVAKHAEDLDKFVHLTTQPFSFLHYNKAQFSVDLKAPYTSKVSGSTLSNSLDDWKQVIQNEKQNFSTIDNIVQTKIEKINTRRKRLNKVNNKLDTHIDYLKEQFEQKSKKFQNNTYIKFLGTRTIQNIEIIREAQDYSKRVENALKNKRLITRPIRFFERAATLFLGETGVDIIHDLESLGYTNREDSMLALKYLLLVLKVIKMDEDNYTAPIMVIMDLSKDKRGYEKSEILKVIAGHCFVHTISIGKKVKSIKTIRKAKTPQGDEFDLEIPVMRVSYE